MQKTFWSLVHMPTHEFNATPELRHKKTIHGNYFKRVLILGQCRISE